MEEQKTVLLSLEFDTEEGLKRAANFRSAIDADKEALTELNKVIKKNGEQSQEQLVQREKLEQNIKKNTKARTDELRSIENYLKASKASTGSIKEMRAEVAFLTEKYTGLSKAERENIAIGGKLQAHIKSLNDDLKAQEGAYGDNRRSVGGYLDAIRQAPGAMGKMKAGISGISTALSASPLGLLTNILPQIIGFFNSSGEGADFFAKAMGGVNAVLQVGMKYLVSFAGYLVDAGEKAVTAFKSPKVILTELVDFLKNNLLNRFKAFAVILEGIQTADFRKITDGVIQFGTGITDATKKGKDFVNQVGEGMKNVGKEIADAANAGANLEDQLDKLAERERALAREASNTKKEINALSIQARNRTLSEKERMDLLDKADKLQLSLNDKQLKLERDRLKLIEEQNKLKQEDSDEQDQRVTDQIVRINELEEAGANIREKFQVRRDALADAAAERENKRQEELEKQFEKDKKRLQEELKLFMEVAEKTEEINERHLGFDRDRQAERDKMLATDTKRLDKQLKDELERSNAAIAQSKREAQEKLDEKEKEYQTLVSFTSAASGLAAALAEENSSLAEFQRAVTLFEIGLASAEAISKGIAASQDLPFPGNLIAMGTTIATISTNLIRAKQLMDGGPAPKYKAAEGGVLDGPSHAEGGITGTGRFANVEVEGNEIILTKGVYLNPALRAVANQLNIAGGGKPLMPTNYAAMGGFIKSTTGAAINNTPGIDYNKLAKAIAAQPAPVVSVSRLSEATLDRDSRQKRVTLGA